MEFFTLENLGVRTLEPVISNKDKRTEEILYSTTKKKDCYYGKQIILIRRIAIRWL